MAISRLRSSRFASPYSPYTPYSRLGDSYNYTDSIRNRSTNPFNKSYNNELEIPDSYNSDNPYNPQPPPQPDIIDYSGGIDDTGMIRSPTPPKEQKPFSFMDEYSKIARPNRLAYQKAVEQGNPEIQRGKLAKTLAILGGAGSGFATGDIPGSVNMAVSAYERPQQRADQLYKEKLARLSSLSSLEDSDVQDKMKALELQRGDWWKDKDYGLRQKEDARQEIESTLRQNADVRDAKLDDATLKKMAYDLAHAGDRVITDPVTGISKIVKEDGTERIIGQSQLSKLQETIFGAQKAGAERTAQNIADEPYEEKKRQAALEQALKVENARGENRLALATANRETQIAKIREKAANTPDVVAKQMLLDLGDEIAKENLPDDAASYLHFDENGTPYISGGATGSSKTEVVMRDWLARSLSKNRSAGAPGESTSQSNSGRTSTGVDWSAKEVPGPGLLDRAGKAISGMFGGDQPAPLTNKPLDNLDNMSHAPAPVPNNMSPNVPAPVMSSQGGVTPPNQSEEDKTLAELEVAIEALKKARANKAPLAEIARLMQAVAAARVKVR